MNFFHEERLGKWLIVSAIVVLSGHVIWALVRYLIECEC
jgi:hypothetical protein